MLGLTTKLLVPRALEYSTAKIGLAQRTRIQALQLKKRTLRAARYLADLALVKTAETRIEQTAEQTIIAIQTKALRHDMPVMVVDDNESILSLVKAQLTKLGFMNVVTYSSPFDAIAHIKTGQEMPRLLITDLSMPENGGPEMRGDQLIRSVVKLCPTGQIPRFIIFSRNPAPTAEESPEVLAAIEQHKANYVQKGFNQAQFNQLICQISADIAADCSVGEPVILTFTKVKNEFNNNPTYSFMRRVLHAIGNALTPIYGFLQFKEQAFTNFSEPINRNLTLLFERRAKLEAFAQSPELHTAQALAQTDLPDKLLLEKPLQKIWQRMSPKQKQTCAKLVLEYLHLGLDEFCVAMRELEQLMSEPAEASEKAIRALEIYHRAARALTKVDDGVLLDDMAEPDLEGPFLLLYKS